MATTLCPLRCPAGGWQQIPNTGNDHCYLFPPKPVPVMNFWDYQNYCASLQPTSYIVTVNTQKEYSSGATKAFSYFLTYVVGSFFVWLGAYYKDGQFYWLDGSPWGEFNAMFINPLKPPAEGDCVYVDPKSTLGSWYYRPCTDSTGATICEMLPLADCSGTTLPVTTPPPYADPDCNQPAMSDFVRQQQSGYLGVAEIMTLTGQDTLSCAVACTYYSGCLSFDISTSGDCRLLGDSGMAMCSSFVPDDTYQHYDLASLH